MTATTEICPPGIDLDVWLARRWLMQGTGKTHRVFSPFDMSASERAAQTRFAAFRPVETTQPSHREIARLMRERPRVRA